jgi:DNA-binding MarR family transcriptional regulator
MVPDHIGWTLWRATLVWRKDFVAGMVAAGHPWFAQGRGNIVGYIGPNGVRQTDLVDRALLTKQAVQQFVDELVADGIVLRTPDAKDARAKWVHLTPAGQAAMRDADRIKVEIETRWRKRLGSDDFDRLAALLRRVIANEIVDPGAKG